MAKTKQVLLATTVIAAGAWQPNRFVNFAGTQAAAGEASLGVSTYEADQGDAAAVDVLGIATVEAGGAIAQGAQVSAGDQGLAVTQASTAVVCGHALDAAAAAGDIIRILLRG